MRARKTRARRREVECRGFRPLLGLVGPLFSNQVGVAPRLPLLIVDSYKGAGLGSTFLNRVSLARACTFCLRDNIDRASQLHLINLQTLPLASKRSIPSIRIGFQAFITVTWGFCTLLQHKVSARRALPRIRQARLAVPFLITR